MTLLGRTEIENLGELKRILAMLPDDMEISVHGSIHKYVELWRGTGGKNYLAIQGSDVEQQVTVQ